MYSADPRIHEAVETLVKSNKPNPYGDSGTAPTISDITEVIRYVYGKKAARSVRITVH